ncbi:MAG: polyprenol monophosphomannose synthase [Deltaproteobacteria bacterium]|nr:polyprenol monophosphomannose synthase [Deltaproteobacteria bacterium]
MKTLIVIPTYNEIENIKRLVSEIFQHVDQNTHVLVIDDNSPDGTGDLADVLAESNPCVHVIHRAKKLGLGTAYVAGFKYALENGYDVVFEMDSDFSHDPKYLPLFQQEIEKYDGVIGSRYVPGGGVLNWGLCRRVISRGGSLYAKLLLNLPFQDLTGGFNCWKRGVLEAIVPSSLKSDGYAFQIEMKYRAFKKGFRLKEIPIVFEDRYLGQSKMSKKIVIEAMYRVLLMRLSQSRLGRILPELESISGK